jgi:hypothetical protein
MAYQPYPMHAGLSDPEITQQICQREIYRYNKNFSAADTIRSSLKAQGVEVYDKESRWTARDGRSGTVPKYAEAEALMAQAAAMIPHAGVAPVASAAMMPQGSVSQGYGAYTYQ